LDSLNAHTNIGIDNKVLLTSCQYLFVSERTTVIRDTRFKDRKANMVCEIHEENARQCVDDGNILLTQQNISGAINKYNEAIKERPYYAIPHYNKRIALSNNLLINNSQDINLASRVDPYFVINIIAAVPERRFSDDSSDEEPDEEFNAMYDELENNNVWPFTTRPKKTIKIKTESKILDLEPNSYKNQDTADSMVVNPLLNENAIYHIEIFVNTPRIIPKQKN